jgi:hypothetical protein
MWYYDTKQMTANQYCLTQLGECMCKASYLRNAMFLLISFLFISGCSQEPLTAPDQDLPKGNNAAIHSSVAPSKTILEGKMANGAQYLISVPDEWNEHLVVYAHGYVSPLEPVEIPVSQLYLPDGAYIPDLLNDMEYAFATTSYRGNGLVVNEAVIDLVELVFLFKEYYPHVKHIYLIGVSEGGLITTKSLELKKIYNGGIAICGPIGDFRKQVDYIGDFRVLFDYFFPGAVPGNAIAIPEDVQKNWDAVYVPLITALLAVNPDKTLQLLRTAGAPFDPAQPESAGASVLGVLWYNVFATNDAVEKLGGNPFDNSSRRYHGSDNDALLNRSVHRFTADPAAIANLERDYQTSGNPNEFLEIMHNTGDPIVPIWHARMYGQKVIANGRPGYVDNFHIARYGHCNVTADEALRVFSILVLKVEAKENLEPPQPTRVAQEHLAAQTQ